MDSNYGKSRLGRTSFKEFATFPFHRDLCEIFSSLICKVEFNFFYRGTFACLTFPFVQRAPWAMGGLAKLTFSLQRMACENLSMFDFLA